jgi:two-component system, sensor histidine kinase
LDRESEKGIPMVAAQWPLDEQGRLEALRRYRILDTSPEEAFDDFVRMAALICRAPISLLTLIDATRQWFKAKVGLVEPELPRESAFCAHAILGTELLVVPDALADPRFAANPLVLGAPQIRFYAGAPLVTPDGFGLGTLCVIDRVPRSIGPQEAWALRGLARQVICQMELRRTLLEVAERNAELDAFSSTAAHDLRAPLRAIRGFAEIVGRDYAGKVLDSEAKQLLAHIDEAAARMDALVEGLLAYARVTRVDVRLEAVDLGPVVHDVLRDLAPDIAARKAEVEVPDELPVVRGHPVALRQALANLISNAVKFVPPERTPRVSLNAELHGDRVVLVVRDNGIGIDPALRARLFKPFSRLHGQDAPYPGVGIGLAIVGKAAERMGGHAGVESEPGKGSRFWIDLGLAQPKTTK